MPGELIRHYSVALKRELQVMVYGKKGVPVLAFPKCFLPQFIML